MIASKSFVKDLIRKTLKRFLYYKNGEHEDTFKFGINEYGEYGYIKNGEIIPFRYVHDFDIIMYITQDKTSDYWTIPEGVDFIIVGSVYPSNNAWNTSKNTSAYSKNGGVLNHVGESITLDYSGIITANSLYEVTQVITWENPTKITVTRSGTGGLNIIYCCKYRDNSENIPVG